jgi:hypothetical protein
MQPAQLSQQLSTARLQIQQQKTQDDGLATVVVAVQQHAAGAASSTTRLACRRQDSTARTMQNKCNVSRPDEVARHCVLQTSSMVQHMQRQQSQQSYGSRLHTAVSTIWYLQGGKLRAVDGHVADL